ncbi:hypothetical protein GIB67_032333 [Kingdonia uniflora]|uniref:TF-B3 domain-containing protein n=1 Tax=Kingdonia uniflora TaxID=39325 RepID=A0A7J7MXQ6_9MAGN|nr:hypothetical protein GIB67_032333 [Kingdonia uniflora]
MLLLTVIPEASKTPKVTSILPFFEGDGLVFQLTKATEFQVFIIRAYSSSGVDKGFGLRVSEALTKQIPPCRPTGIHEKIDHIRANTCAKNGTNQLQHLPPSFYSLYLPNQDVTYTLVDEDTGDCKVKFKYANRRVGCGWRRLSTAHELVVGDAMVFHLVKPAEFKVYIIRAYSLSGVDKGLRDSEAPAMQNTSCTPIRTHEKTKLKCPSTLPFESFDVTVDGLRKNSELPKGMWTKYYELCRSQNVFLHGNLLKQNIKLVDRVISETVILANGIKSSKLSTFINDFAAWDRSLEGLEHLGMNVGFLCTKLQRLENLVSESEHERYAKKRKEILDEFVRMEEWKRLDVVLLSLKRRAETHTQKFQEEVNAPW